MDAKELETYQVQLSHVELALQTDPDNAELKELIDLTKQTLEASSSTTSGASSSMYPAATTTTTTTSSPAPFPPRPLIPPLSPSFDTAPVNEL